MTQLDPLQYVLDRWAVKLEPRQKLPLDIYTMSRDDLAVLFHELGYRTGVEIGVERGLYSEVLLSSNPDLNLYLVDPWKAHREYRDHTSQSKLTRFHEEAQERLKQFGKRARFFRALSMDATKRFRRGDLDFVYIDANHTFDYCMMDIIEWSKRVRPGGIVAGHDYMRRPPKGYHNWGVIKAAVSYADAHQIAPWFTIGGARQDEVRSFFWIRPEGP